MLQRAGEDDVRRVASRLWGVVGGGRGDRQGAVGGGERALDFPTLKLHVFFELGDHLGSTSTVLDMATGELVEKGTFQAYGGAESDFRPGRWKWFREDYRFTGKEDDVEVGLTYFGNRYRASVGTWTSADPLVVQGVEAWNPYAYVRGRAYARIDPNGLEDQEPLAKGNDLARRPVTQAVVAAFEGTRVRTTRVLATLQATRNVNAVSDEEPSPSRHKNAGAWAVGTVEGGKPISHSVNLRLGTLEMLAKADVLAADAAAGAQRDAAASVDARKKLTAGALVMNHELGHAWVHSGFLGDTVAVRRFDSVAKRMGRGAASEALARYVALRASLEMDRATAIAEIEGRTDLTADEREQEKVRINAQVDKNIALGRFSTHDKKGVVDADIKFLADRFLGVDGSPPTNAETQAANEARDKK